MSSLQVLGIRLIDKNFLNQSTQLKIMAYQNDIKKKYNLIFHICNIRDFFTNINIEMFH